VPGSVQAFRTSSRFSSNPQPGLRGRDPVVDVRVVGQADGEPGDEPAVADRIQHRQLLGGAQRLAALAQRPAERQDPGGDAFGLGGVGDGSFQDVRVRGHVIGALAVLGDGDGVEAGSRRVHHLLQRAAERAVDLSGLGQLEVRGGDDRLGVAFLEVAGQVPVGDLLEVGDLHRTGLSSAVGRVF